MILCTPKKDYLKMGSSDLGASNNCEVHLYDTYMENIDYHAPG